MFHFENRVQALLVATVCGSRAAEIEAGAEGSSLALEDAAILQGFANLAMEAAGESWADSQGLEINRLTSVAPVEPAGLAGPTAPPAPAGSPGGSQLANGDPGGSDPYDGLLPGDGGGTDF